MDLGCILKGLRIRKKDEKRYGKNKLTTLNLKKPGLSLSPPPPPDLAREKLSPVLPPHPLDPPLYIHAGVSEWKVSDTMKDSVGQQSPGDTPDDRNMWEIRPLRH